MSSGRPALSLVGGFRLRRHFLASGRRAECPVLGGLSALPRLVAPFARAGWEEPGFATKQVLQDGIALVLGLLGLLCKAFGRGRVTQGTFPLCQLVGQRGPLAEGTHRCPQ